MNASLRERLAASFNLLPAAVPDTLVSVLFGRLLVAALKLGVFEALSGDPRSIEELSGNLKIPERSAALIAESLEAGGYLRRKGKRYGLSVQSKKWLLKDSAFSIGNFIEYIGLLHERWSTLEETLRAGKPPRSYVESFGANEWRVYTLGMKDLARLTLPRIRHRFVLPASSRTLLDVGGSHGLYSIALCRRYPKLSATIADFPQVLAHTRNIVDESGLGKRITLLPCDVTRSLPRTGSFDAAIAFNIAHGFDAETNRSLFASIAAALRPAGVLYVLDQVRDDRRRGMSRMLPLMVGVNLMNETGGTTYTREELESFIRGAHFGPVRPAARPLPGVSLMSAVKAP